VRCKIVAARKETKLVTGDGNLLFRDWLEALAITSEANSVLCHSTRSPSMAAGLF